MSVSFRAEKFEPIKIEIPDSSGEYKKFECKTMTTDFVEKLTKMSNKGKGIRAVSKMMAFVFGETEEHWADNYDVTTLNQCIEFFNSEVTNQSSSSKK